MSVICSWLLWAEGCSCFSFFSYNILVVWVRGHLAKCLGSSWVRCLAQWFFSCDCKAAQIQRNVGFSVPSLYKHNIPTKYIQHTQRTTGLPTDLVTAVTGSTRFRSWRKEVRKGITTQRRLWEADSDLPPWGTRDTDETHQSQIKLNIPRCLFLWRPWLLLFSVPSACHQSDWGGRDRSHLVGYSVTVF